MILASVKSYFGSRGVSRQGFRGLADESKHTKFKGHLLFNEEEVRQKVIEEAAALYGYEKEQIEFRLYVGKFANESHQAAIVEHLGNIDAGAGPIRVFDLKDILSQLRKVLETKTYSNDPVVALLRALDHGGELKEPE